MDTVDDSPVYSIHPFGRDHFAVGSGQDALVKLFDMRMPGKDSYSYLSARPSRPQAPSPKRQTATPLRDPITNTTTNASSSKNISIFLSHKVPLSGRARNRSVRYRGPVYALSSPSPSSSTVYAGVEDNLVRLDFAATDDLFGPSGSWYNDNLGLDLQLDSKVDDNVLNVPCYERPPPTDMDRGLRLLMQEPLSTEACGAESGTGDVRPGWDRRWRHPS